MRVLMIGTGRDEQTTAALFRALASAASELHNIELILKGPPRGILGKIAIVLKPDIAAWKRIARCDAVVLHTAASLSIQEVLLARLLGRRVSIFLWDVYPESTIFMSGGKATLVTRLFGILEKLALRCAGKILVPNADYSRHPSVKKLRNVSHFPMWPAQPNTVEVHPPDRKDDTLRIGFAGQINAIRDLHSAILSIAGRTPGKLEVHLFSNDKLKLRLNRPPIPAHVSIVERGFLPEPELAAAMSGLDAGLISLDPDYPLPAFPSKVFAYVDSGIPVLFFGPEDSAAGCMIEETGIGVVLRSNSETAIDAELELLRENFQASRERFLALTRLDRARIAQIF